MLVNLSCPKQTTRAKKAARKKAATVAQEDSELYAQNLSLTSIETALSSEATYVTSAAVLSKFHMVDNGFKFKTPTARTISSLPAMKPVITADSITHILRSDQIDTCYRKVVALQRKLNTVSENALAVNIPGFGVYSTKTLRTMKAWHAATKTNKLVEKALTWVNTIDFTLAMPSSFKVDEHPELIAKVKSIPLSSRKAELLDLVGKTCLSGDTINTVMAKLFGPRSNVMIVDPWLIGSIESNNSR
ncbi:hypothetical protein F442_23222 [Phytophthora nicotianae P10297]|uniref:Uncharacterized protein n=1 Tax=Phytophthora nicotianae P10297 TaxID=1317064 RepID=W2XY99_PHYNI|nr:hypothetical protein F442_23222 [Phytophthora nicotianae P10297]